MIKLIFIFSICFFSFAYASIHQNCEISQLSDDPRKLYLDLVKKCVANTIYQDPDHSNIPYNDLIRQNGEDWPSIAHTMIGMKRLDNIQYCMEYVIENNIPGDVIETGVWRGGATILMRAILKAYGCKDRKVWVADSFAGLPPPNPEKYPLDRNLFLNLCPFLAVPLDKVMDNFRLYGLLDCQVVFLKGLFSKTLPTAPIRTIAVLRLDGDLYESTMDSLINLYPKVSTGGFIIIDDYGAIAACAEAVQDYRNQNGITDTIMHIDVSGVFWQKSK